MQTALVVSMKEKQRALLEIWLIYSRIHQADVNKRARIPSSTLFRVNPKTESLNTKSESQHLDRREERILEGNCSRNMKGYR